MNQTQSQTFKVDPDEQGQGTLIITDASVLLRPASVAQYHNVAHDTSHAFYVLMLGDDMGLYETHIVCHTSPEEAHKMLDRMFHAYVDGMCMSATWFDAIVNYLDRDGNIVKREWYGMKDGNHTSVFNVYCVGEWEQNMAMVMERVDTTRPWIMVNKDDESEDGYTVTGFNAES